jgi:hypothetical protein
MAVTTHKQRKRKAHPVPTEPGYYWVRMADPNAAADCLPVNNDRIVEVERSNGYLLVESRDLCGVIGHPPSAFPCHAWGPRVSKPVF